MRVALAATADGYVIAGGETGARPLDSRLFVTTLRDGVAGKLRYLPTTEPHASEAVLASDGKRVAIAWNEDQIVTNGEGRTTVHAALVDARGTVKPVFATKPPTGRHDRIQALAWDGCRFALVHTIGINPSAIELVRF